MNRAIVSKDAAEQLQSDGTAAAGGTPEQLLARIRKDIELWKKVIAESGVKLQ